MKCVVPLTTALLLATACARSGVRGNSAQPDLDGGANSGGGVADLAAACSAPALGSPSLRLLTRTEFDRTISDIFPQIKSLWTNSLPSDTVSSRGFDNDNSNEVGNQKASALLDTALSVATALTGSPLATLLPCSSTSADRACADQFVTQYGRRLFRRPLSQAEHDRYLTFFDSALAKSEFKSALKWIAVGLIQSPNAIYRSEIGVDDGTGTRTLSSYELATELAYTYTGSTPTDALLSQADSGNLGDVVALAKSLMVSVPPDSQGHPLQHFFDSYLGYTGVAAIQKPNIANFGSLSGDMMLETQNFVADVVFQKGGGLKELLTAPTTNPSKSLALRYGFPFPATASDYASIARPTGRGIGILAQGSFLATHANADASSPTQRGLFVFTHLLCHDKPTPPPNVPQISGPQPGKVTTRQRYEQLHAGAGACAACHKQWDPIGFGFEHYDEGGFYRQDEDGLPIDSSAAVPNPDGSVLFSFADEESLVAGLAEQALSYRCFAGYLATYAFGDGTSCLGSSQVASLQSGNMGIVDAFAALAAEPHFTKRATP